jgi:GT2 family glycosyltransferase
MLSIVTITYNNYDELKETLSSIPHYGFVERVVINGGACKKTSELLSSFDGISISEKDEGIADAFNKGIKNSSGEFILFLNSGDMLISPNYLAEVIEVLKKNSDIGFIHTNVVFEDAAGCDLLLKPPMKNFGFGMKYLHPGMIVRKEIFKKIGMFDTSFKSSMDFDFTLRMELAGIKGYYINSGGVIRMKGTGISSIKEWEGIKECLRSMRKNNYLSIVSFLSWCIRAILFFFRKGMMVLGLKSILAKLKLMKPR